MSEGFEDKVQGVFYFIDHHIGIADGLPGRPLPADDGDTERRLLYHEVIVIPIPDSDGLVGTNRNDKLLFLLGPVFFIDLHQFRVGAP